MSFREKQIAVSQFQSHIHTLQVISWVLREIRWLFQSNEFSWAHFYNKQEHKHHMPYSMHNVQVIWWVLGETRLLFHSMTFIEHLISVIHKGSPTKTLKSASSLISSISEPILESNWPTLIEDPAEGWTYDMVGKWTNGSVK